jgi:NarL family two-component system response regulator LiaR
LTSFAAAVYRIVMDKVRILFIDDHPLIRRGLSSFLAETGRFVIAGEASSLDHARELLAGITGPLDLILLDISLGEENGLDFLKTLKSFYGPSGHDRPAAAPHGAPVTLVYSTFEDPFRVQNALDLGAMGYIPKSAGEDELLKAIDAVLSGQRYVYRGLEIKIHERPNYYNLLTSREREVLGLIKQHYDNRRIAKALSMSPRTVENHLSHIYLKTGFNSRESLLAL